MVSLKNYILNIVILHHSKVNLSVTPAAIPTGLSNRLDKSVVLVLKALYYWHHLDINIAVS